MSREILLFGDSNTWGYVPPDGSRYPREVRWTGVAASLLGDGYELIEDAISGRTTVYEDPQTPKRCGIDGLGYALAAHHPLDMVVLFLGGNDLKFTDAEGFGRGLERLVRYVLDAQEELNLKHPVFKDEKRILIVGTKRINPAIERLFPNSRQAHSAAESTKLSGQARRVAEKYGTYFLDASELVFPDETDCIHLKPADHRVLGTAIARAIREAFTTDAEASGGIT